ncbi:355_t:CDS:2 [Ambispora gerdemannii]|uniref:355_t:CDS:1 n=1 Tax=Ambispora gerdemannii TaxID=144530 RepID=A0A9N9H7L0_9GLOM|nr:355_t:CDS:2 [Ambispora gerdemannii]
MFLMIIDVENFRSSLRHQIQKFNTAEQIIRQARTVDQMRDTFVDFSDHNIRYSAKQLEYLEKRTALFLLNLFTNVYRYQNLGKSTISMRSSSKSKHYKFPTLGINGELINGLTDGSDPWVDPPTFTRFQSLPMQMFQKSSSSIGKIAIEEDDTSNGLENVVLDNGIDQLCEKALDALKTAKPEKNN